MSEPKRGRTHGRRRNVVSVSLDAATLYDLDALQTQFQAWAGRPLSRSAVIKKLVHIGSAAVAGRDVSDLRMY